MPRNAKIILRNGTSVPAGADFDIGEPAWNRDTGTLYIKNAAGSMVAIGGGSSPSISTTNYTTTSLAAGASTDFTLNLGTLYTLLSVTSNFPAWVRLYNTSAARTNDTRTTPGYPYPASGTGFYAEVLTTATPQTITLAPTPICQGTSSTSYLRVVNRDSVTRTLQLSFTHITTIS